MSRVIEPRSSSLVGVDVLISAEDPIDAPSGWARRSHRALQTGPSRPARTTPMTGCVRALGHEWRRFRCADDFVMVFSEEADARRVHEVLPKRFGRYGLKLHPEKTRLVGFQRPGPKAGARREANRHWWRALGRRSQRYLSWARFRQIERRCTLLPVRLPSWRRRQVRTANV